MRSSTHLLKNKQYWSLLLQSPARTRYLRPPLNLDLSPAILHHQLLDLFWLHFISNCQSNSPYSFGLSCPCSKCKYFPKILKICKLINAGLLDPSGRWMGNFVLLRMFDAVWLTFITGRAHKILPTRLDKGNGHLANKTSHLLD